MEFSAAIVLNIQLVKQSERRITLGEWEIKLQTLQI